MLAVEPDVIPNFCGDMSSFKETFLAIIFHWQYSRRVLSISMVCPDLDPEVGDSGSWNLWQKLRGCVSDSVSAVTNAIRRSLPFIKRSVW